MIGYLETVHQYVIQTNLIDRFSEGVETPAIMLGIIATP